MNFPALNIQLPGWIESFLNNKGEIFPNIVDRMGLVIELSRRNIEQKTGGPFGAAVFDHTGRLISPGINMVTSSNCSLLHAEVVAMIIAQKVLGRYDIGNGGKLSYDLVSSTEPCAMCFGALLWSGVNRLICGARDEDARAIGFDEGPKLPDWIEELNLRNIAVQRDVMREEAAAILNEYVASGEPIYNAGR